ncbi:translation factor GTPase family protein [Candidatus Epulonipiscium viviparus]|uniref:translation factor GTPase family protein n=1 Tax=Candidatus Epulonipiscium viviparus TaxID=420336 RepID=UPI0027380F1F|nr:TetM/TetW/TetO/TetS family tetracycline resistance ribosomal protection protein [Candidatus Epulopiscium viviparus]
MKKITIGLVAHVDSGKTTLAEGLLFESGKIKTAGRVDKKDAFFDSHDLEKSRGITIFSKQAQFEYQNLSFILLDTPGHVDFASEMERTLFVLDYAILIISATDGIKGHTRTLAKLLSKYNVPTFIFINKMDQADTDKAAILELLHNDISDNCVSFDETATDFLENVAVCDDLTLEKYLETTKLTTAQIINLIATRKVFPVCFGSALKLSGIREFLDLMVKYMITPTYAECFAAKVFKITFDPQGNRLTHLKVIGGHLKVREIISYRDLVEKITEIRIYESGGYKTATEVAAGDVCSVLGLSKTKAGDTFGESLEYSTKIEPVLNYKIVATDETNIKVLYEYLQQLNQEEPMLNIIWREDIKEIEAKIMGEVQIEVLTSIIKERFNVSVTFLEGTVLYKETIQNEAVGVGHYEPLRHYAEVMLKLEPQPTGTGIVIHNACASENLEKNYQQQIISYLKNNEHRGMLAGYSLTDIKITLLAGISHKKHTSPNDFKEATRRALRQALKQVDSLILEPYYNFVIHLPEANLGRALNDIERFYGVGSVSNIENQTAIITGQAPISTIAGYQKELIAYTRGLGSISFEIGTFNKAHNSAEIIANAAYNADADLANPAYSVFCSHGAGFMVPWDQVFDYMHLEQTAEKKSSSYEQYSISAEEIDQIINRATANTEKKRSWKKVIEPKEKKEIKAVEYKFAKKKEYILVDAYNVIFAHTDFRELMNKNLDSARIALLDELTNYQALKRCEIIAVFDAYKVKGGVETMEKYHNIYVVFTKEAQTADHYIERFVHQNVKEARITVVTSDHLEQLIIIGKGANVMSAKIFRACMQLESNELLDEYLTTNRMEKNFGFGDLLL